jgi:hypothetical protein
MSFIILFLSGFLWAHEGHHPPPHTQEAKTNPTNIAQTQIFTQIQSAYLQNVKPIFDQKCAACHSSDVASPWYAKIPIVHWIVESDRSEAKEHLETSKGFPFAGHGTIKEDLDAIADEVKDSEMPPLLYKIFHPSSRLTENEKQIILKWIDDSQKQLPAEEKAP